MQRIPKERSGYRAPWALVDYWKWRLRHGGTLDDAYGELVKLLASGVIEASGIYAAAHPERQNEEPHWHQPFVDPATTHPIGTPLLAVLPRDISNLRPVTDADGQPTSDLDATGSIPGPSSRIT